MVAHHGTNNIIGHEEQSSNSIKIIHKGTITLTCLERGKILQPHTFLAPTLRFIIVILGVCLQIGMGGGSSLRGKRGENGTGRESSLTPYMGVKFSPWD